MRISLTIAGFDPSGGAGIQADLKVFQALGVYGLSAAAALTAQNTCGVAGVQAVESRFLKKQLDVLLADIVPDSTKIGMLLSSDNVAAAATAIRKHGIRNVVLDPVFISSSGKKLSETSVPTALRKKLLPLCRVITPNISEAEVLSGMKITDQASMKRAAEMLKELGPEVVIITGGHSKGAPVDIFFDGKFHEIKGRRVRGEFHGTGCTFSSAVAAFLALGMSPYDAAKKAKRFIAKALNNAAEAGSGMKVLNLSSLPARR